MAIWKLFSQRQKEAARGGQPDVYQYSGIPGPLRNQLHQISLDGLGKVGAHRGYGYSDVDNPVWGQIDRVFCKEHGLMELAAGDFAGERVLLYMRSCPTDHWLDLVELICDMLGVIGSGKFPGHGNEWETRQEPAEAVEEINYQLKQAGVGYQYTENYLVRVDSQFIHAEVVKPALLLISGTAFAGPREEFMAAHQHYRSRENRQAVAMAANALESTLKAVFDQKQWPYAKGSRISDLVKVARTNGLWPDYLDASFDQLVATLQSGLPKIRDNDASHGQGAVPKEVPNFVAAYALHLAASKIVFITECANAAGR